MDAVVSRRTRVRHWLRVGVIVMAIALGLGLTGFLWYRVAHVLSTGRPIKTPTVQPVSGVVWGGRVFESKSSLAAWLRYRGRSYATWASRHPSLAHVLESH